MPHQGSIGETQLRSRLRNEVNKHGFLEDPCTCNGVDSVTVSQHDTYGKEDRDVHYEMSNPSVLYKQCSKLTTHKLVHSSKVFALSHVPNSYSLIRSPYCGQQVYQALSSYMSQPRPAHKQLDDYIWTSITRLSIFCATSFPQL